MDRFEVLNNFYETHDEDARFESKSGRVEFLTTLNYIEKYLKKGDNIIEIGAGTGRYSHYFARSGHSVTAVELTEHNIEKLKRNTQSGESIDIIQGDAVLLSKIPSNKYNITLLLGPMYHLYVENDKLSALSEAIRVTKPGGIIFAAYCASDTTVYRFCFARGGIHSEQHKDLIDPDTFALSSTPEEIFSLYRKEEIDGLMKNFKVKRLHYIGTDMLTEFISSSVDEMDDETFDIYMKYHLFICERTDMVGLSDHVLDIFQKESI